ncbi:uncharacterized protein SETTUDRAFT_30922 [Exserohilum turcica Et28A]|uniref:Uncharacterized protein n=1 Tax=Exserohilum turcicum (strain 28A) TaxID=671987 RepID=R0KEN7_EXST2|nr:uncharacterized protein SETTUDRAFT_30922 [Exserohilum turcica Et28A]EOA86587.1 hypothetical protein SETTUDRAFT_30922 [Exserohilum turcica Et28A]
MTEDLISFDDDDNNNMNSTQPGMRDSFADLTRLMREKKPYAVTSRAPSAQSPPAASAPPPPAAPKDSSSPDLRLELMKERLRNIELEDEIEGLKNKLREQQVQLDTAEAQLKHRENRPIATGLESENEELKIKLREQRVQLKTAEAQLKHCENRLLEITKNGMSLQGAAHLVKPNANTQLPKTVFACSECYANNLECDNNATCRSCTDRGETCARWRCSLKHRLGNCPLTPCKLAHDEQGWLMLRTERPQW